MLDTIASNVLMQRSKFASVLLILVGSEKSILVFEVSRVLDGFAVWIFQYKWTKNLELGSIQVS